MDHEQLIREVLAVKEPACLQELLVCHCNQFDTPVAKAVKERVDEVNRADPRQALALAEAGWVASEICSKTIARAWMLWAWAHAQMQLEDYQSGLASCDTALEILHGAGDIQATVQVQVSRLFALVSLGQEEEAIGLVDTIRATLEQHDDRDTLARLDMNVGIAYDNTDRYEQALRCFKSAATRFKVLGKPLEVVRARINSAIALENLDRYDDAIAIYTEIRPALAALNKPMVLARNDFNMAVLHFWLGDYARALDEFEVARQAFSKLDVPAEMDQVDLYRAMLYLELNLFSEVVDTCSEVGRRAGERGIVRDVVLARRLAALAHGYRRWPGDWSSAVMLLEEAQALAIARGSPLQAAQMDLDMALLLLDRRLPEQALSLARQAAACFSERRLRAKQARAHIVCGRCLQSLARLDQAGTHLRIALDLVEGLSLSQLAVHCHRGLGQIAEAQCNREQARRYYDLAIAGIERLRKHILVDDFRASFLEDKLQVYADAARLCLERADLDAAFGYVQRAKARVILDFISASAPATLQTEPAIATAIRERLRSLERRWNALQSRQLPDPRELQDRGELVNTDMVSPQLQHNLAEIERQVVALRRELQVLTPTVSGLTGETVLGLADLQRRLTGEITLLEYFVDDERIVAFVVDKNRCRFSALEARPDWEKQRQVIQT